VASEVVLDLAYRQPPLSRRLRWLSLLIDAHTANCRPVHVECYTHERDSDLCGKASSRCPCLRFGYVRERELYGTYPSFAAWERDLRRLRYPPQDLDLCVGSTLLGCGLKILDDQRSRAIIIC
jgi:hypothetical protein